MRLPWVILAVGARLGAWWRGLSRGQRRTLVSVLAAALAMVGLARAAGHSSLVRELVIARATAEARAHGFELRSAADAFVAWPGQVELSQVVMRRGEASLQAGVVAIRPVWLGLARGELDVASVAVSTARLSFAGATWVVREGELTRDGYRALVRLLFEGGGAAAVEATLGSTPTAVGRLTRLSAADLPPELRHPLEMELDGTWDGELELTGERLRLTLATADLTLGGEMVASEPVGPFALRADVDLSWDGDVRLSIVDARLELGPDAALVLGAAGSVDLEGDGELELTLAVPELARLAATLPANLQPPPAAPELRGPLSASLRVRGPWRRPLEWVVESKVDLSASRAVARTTPLAGAFTHVVSDVLGREHAIRVSSESPDFVPIDELPSYVKDAVTTAEDAGFYAHQGFDFGEIRNSVLAVASAGRAVRGGSTISQQLAKNLFLSREKTYARKVREALVTIALESSLSKARLLEIYLNVIEWGPGIYGIGPAARAYFGKDARALTPREAAYLASIVPNPVRYFAHHERGAISERWATRVDALLFTLAERGQLSPEVYGDALSDPLVFTTN